MILKCTVADAMELTTREITAEGYLKAPATLARTGIQTYRAREFPPLTQQGMDPDKLIRLHRPAEEVFHPESMSSFESKPVILEPHRSVSAANWRDLAVGDVHGITREGDFLKANSMMIRDKKAIDAVQNGKKFLSNGYTFDLDLTPGRTPDGQDYDGIQRNIRGNHVAIVDAARGGPACRIADSLKGAKSMTKVTIDGIPFEAEDSLVAAVNKLVGERDSARTQAADATKSMTIKVGDSSKTFTPEQLVQELTAKDSEISTLKKQVLTPEQLEAKISERVAVRTALVGDALRLVPDYKADAKTDKQVKIDVITAVTGKDAVAKAVSDAMLDSKTLEAADDAALEGVYKAVVAAASKTATTQTGAGDAAVAAALTGEGQRQQAAAGDAGQPSGRDAFIARQNAAWKGAQK